MTEAKTEQKVGDTPDLSAEETAVLQLVTITPAPRTADELAATYDGLRLANLWPKQSEKAVRDLLDTLVKRKVLKHGDKAPNDEPTVEIA